MSIRNRLIRALGGYTPAEWQREITSMRGSRTPLHLGVVRRLPVRVEAAQLLSRAEDGGDRIVRENMAYRLAVILLERGLIRFEVVEDAGALPELRALAVVYPPEDGPC